MTYYGQVDRLQYQLDFFDNLPAKTKQNVTLQIVNDGYNDAGVFGSLIELYKDRLDLRGYRITVDIGFNSHGARNLLMMESDTHWNMLMVPIRNVLLLQTRRQHKQYLNRHIILLGCPQHLR